MKEDLNRTARFLKVIAEENRLKILCVLKSGEQCVCDIWQALDIQQNLVSHHLKVLKKASLIKFRKEGLWMFYRINDREIKKLSLLLNNFLQNGKK